MKVFITVLLLAYKGHVKYNRLVHFKQQDFAFSQVHSQDVHCCDPASLTPPDRQGNFLVVYN